MSGKLQIAGVQALELDDSPELFGSCTLLVHHQVGKRHWAGFLYPLRFYRLDLINIYSLYVIPATSLDLIPAQSLYVVLATSLDLASSLY